MLLNNDIGVINLKCIFACSLKTLKVCFPSIRFDFLHAGHFLLQSMLKCLEVFEAVIHRKSPHMRK